MSGPILGGGERSARSHSARETGAGSNSFASATPVFERSEFFQACIDVIAVIFIALFLCMTAASLPVALFLLLFCRF